MEQRQRSYFRHLILNNLNPAGSAQTTSSERIVADGIVELLFHYKDPFKIRLFEGSLEQQPTSFIIAQFNHPIEIQPNGIAGFISVRFYPWGAYLFFRRQERNT
ncbi:MAG: hypothetical protein IIA60_09545 [Candidatus Marinimicrobia bacterium]|nr:hypothetical protein [Candidatus Neomarinimicrobiota bacterium]